jgi:hypothetical protein
MAQEKIAIPGCVKKDPTHLQYHQSHPQQVLNLTKEK